MLKRKKILIAGGGYADIPLIKAAKSLGFYVITTGNRPDDLGHCCSDEYHNGDFSQPEVMLALAQKLEISAVCACCNDFSALSAAYVAEQMGLPGHDNVEVSKIIHHKDLFRDFSHQYRLPVPRACGADSIDKARTLIKSFTFPLMVKPVDLTGGKGIALVRSVKEVEGALTAAFAISRAKRIVIEEFVTGSRHGFSSFLVDGKVVFFFSDNEHYYLNPYLVSAASAPGCVSDEINEKLCSICEKYASLLSLKDGIFHVQYILCEGEPVIIEICRRAPGDLYVKLVEYATRVDYSDWIVKASVGLDCRQLVQVKPRGFYLRHCVMPSHVGRLSDIVFDHSIIDNVIDKMMWWQEGQEINDVLTTKFGIVFLKFDSEQEMQEKTCRMHELIRPVIQK